MSVTLGSYPDFEICAVPPHVTGSSWSDPGQPQPRASDVQLHPALCRLREAGSDPRGDAPTQIVLSLGPPPSRRRRIRRGRNLGRRANSPAMRPEVKQTDYLWKITVAITLPELDNMNFSRFVNTFFDLAISISVIKVGFFPGSVKS